MSSSSQIKDILVFIKLCLTETEHEKAFLDFNSTLIIQNLLKNPIFIFENSNLYNFLHVYEWYKLLGICKELDKILCKHINNSLKKQIKWMKNQQTYINLLRKQNRIARKQNQTDSRFDIEFSKTFDHLRLIEVDSYNKKLLNQLYQKLHLFFC